MILSSHIVIASAATASFVNQPASFVNSIIIFIIAFISHYLVDFIPHWDYDLSSVEEFPADSNGYKKRNIIATKKTILKDFLKNLIDGLVGLFGAVLILGFPTDFKKVFLIVLVIFFSVLPDALEILYLIFKKSPLILIHKFHNFVHSKKVFENYPVFGIISQIISVTIISIILLLLANWF